MRRGDPVGPMKVAFLAIAALAVIAAVVIAFRAQTDSSPTISHALQNSMYVWQRSWSDAVTSGVASAATVTDQFFVYAGDIVPDGGGLKAAPIECDWRALAHTGRPVVIVIRASDDFARWLRENPVSTAASSIQNFAETQRSRAKDKGCTVTALQLDYDCPTSRLGRYRERLTDLSRRIHGMELSLTALPDWLQSRDFPALVSTVPWYVLQVHGIEKPQSIEAPITLCDYDKVPGYIAAAARIGHPFLVALPTYGHRVQFGPDGNFRKFAAEAGSAGDLPPDWEERQVFADPVRIAQIVRSLRGAPPRGLLGMVWFRLPVATDRMNWSLPVLEKVIEGRAPRVAIRAEMRQPEPALWEVWIVNHGEADAAGEVSVPLDFQASRVLSNDLMAGYRRSAGGALAGPAPRAGRSLIAAWFRLAPAQNEVTSPAIVAGKVRVLP